MAEDPLDDVGSASKEAALRDKIRELPRNGRLRAELAYNLIEMAKAKSTEDPVHDFLLSEAVRLAQEAIQIAPQKPFGYAALSVASRDQQQRIQALREAVKYSEEPLYFVAKIDLMVRLLVEPRQKMLGKQQSRQDLDKGESTLYKNIDKALEQAWALEGVLSDSNIELLALRDYRLGLFFRKLDPPKRHQPHSRAHFQRTCERLSSLHPSHSLAQFWLATMDDTQQGNLKKCPEEYVVGLYSTFAARFDDLLVGQLAYKTPDHLRQLVNEAVPIDSGVWAPRAADLGCGTGLSGAAFRDCVQKLVGVDLSPEMISKAAERNCYERLVQGDVTSILSPDAGYSLIFACDVFVYLGDLVGVFAGAYKSLLSDGIFAFSTELLDKDDQKPYRLHECARFAHKQSYVEHLAKEMSFEILAAKICPIRKNKSYDVVGFLIVLRKI